MLLTCIMSLELEIGDGFPFLSLFQPFNFLTLQREMAFQKLKYIVTQQFDCFSLKERFMHVMLVSSAHTNRGSRPLKCTIENILSLCNHFRTIPHLDFDPKPKSLYLRLFLTFF